MSMYPQIPQIFCLNCVNLRNLGLNFDIMLTWVVSIVTTPTPVGKVWRVYKSGCLM